MKTISWNRMKEYFVHLWIIDKHVPLKRQCFNACQKVNTGSKVWDVFSVNYNMQIISIQRQMISYVPGTGMLTGISGELGESQNINI